MHTENGLRSPQTSSLVGAANNITTRYITNRNIIEALTKKEHKNGVMSPDSPEVEPEYNLTPRTEAKYSKIDEEFQMMMQRNQLNGSRVGVGVTGGNYNLPVSVPVASYDQSLLQASPQMHTSISPRPSSSETDSVYPSGGMLEMSNGYPGSASPLGAGCTPSPSPGPAPSPHRHAHKHHAPPPPHHSPRANNLRVVIPNSMPPPQDDIGYTGEVIELTISKKNSLEHLRRNVVPTALKQLTHRYCAVALHAAGRSIALTIADWSNIYQTPLSYSGLGNFGAQDFSMGSDMGIGLSWGAHQLQTLQQHNSHPVTKLISTLQLAMDQHSLKVVAFQSGIRLCETYLGSGATEI
ncbi:Myocyte-specific enhancer factor 2 [Eumeta japonica]|uniref:Myocyte-specific enhancer factor 2 n=1 Tax=Eumeta variegata TaxID=151549 RepID=A0A4C1VV54_EUMVA|nr:Myocyte-specific enhancer factor 2 [Eumeta japonica]